MSSFDAIVVGGGIVGASVAYHLQRAGTDTLLVDRNDEGRATDAGAGIVAPLTSQATRTEPWLALATEAAAYYPRLVSQLESESDDRFDEGSIGPIETSFDRPGMLAVAIDEDEVEPFEATLDRLHDRSNRLGRPAPDSYEEIDDERARSMVPELARSRRGFRYDEAGRVDGRQFTDALLAVGRAHGLTVETGEVTEIRIADRSVTGVETAAGRVFETGNVVVAGGAWSTEFGEQLGVDVPISPQRGQIVHLESPNADTGEWPIIKGFRGHYVVPWPDGHVAVGATREPDAGFDSRPTAGGIQEVLEEALRVLPGLADATLTEIRVGLRPVTPDGLPVLGPVPNVSGAYLATGHGPTGLTFGPYSGNVVATLVRDESVPEFLEGFSVDRF